VTEEIEFGPAPRALWYVSILALVAGAAMIFVGGWRTGVTWDEPIHVMRFNTYLETGWYVGDGQLENGKPAPDLSQQYVYAPATMLILHGLGVVTGVEDPGAASASADAYAVRHLGIGLISLLGVVAIAGTARLLFRRWDWALVAAAVLAVFPMWTGHSMFNLKDVPVATGYSLATLGLALISRTAKGRDWRVSVAGPATLAAGTLLAVGTRPGMWVGIAAGIAVLLGCVLLRPGPGSLARRVHDDAWRYRDVLVAMAVAGAGLWLMYPRVFGSPLQALWNAAFASANFLGEPTRWTFVPSRVFLQVPALMLGFVAFAVVLAIKRLIRIRLRPGVFDTRLLLVLTQTFALPIIAIVHQASLYGDLRQLLFAAPATALVVTFGMARLVDLARAGADPKGPPMVAALTCIAVAAPLVDQATLFPYNYVYYNPLTSVARLVTDSDYYRASGRELVPQLPTTGRIVCSPQPDKKGAAMRMAHLDGWVECVSALSSPIAAYADRRTRQLPPLEEDQFWGIKFGGGPEALSNCEPVDSVTRRSRWQRIHLSTLMRCTRPFPVLTTRPVRFDSKSRRDLDFPDLGWLIPGNDGTSVGVRSRGGSSTMKFRLSKEFAGHAVRLVVLTSGESDAYVTFGGLPLDVRASSEPLGLEVVIPREAVDRAVLDAESLDFRSRTSDRLDLKVLGLRAEVAPS
jgi:hypothetical protein